MRKERGGCLFLRGKSEEEASLPALPPLFSFLLSHYEMHQAVRREKWRRGGEGDEPRKGLSRLDGLK